MPTDTASSIYHLLSQLRASSDETPSELPCWGTDGHRVAGPAPTPDGCPEGAVSWDASERLALLPSNAEGDEGWELRSF